ncbi:MAG: hypothetical protein WCC32_13590 [Terriglobales bacterium]|jgi:hypothetical protein
MGWCIGYNTPAGRRYRRRVLTAMSLYMVILFSCLKLVKTAPMHGWLLYLVALLPAVPVIAVLASLGRYLQEETDEYLRMLATRSLLVGSGALLGTIVVNDFLRLIAHSAALSPFVCFAVFFVAFGLAQMVQDMVSRGGNDE